MTQLNYDGSIKSLHETLCRAQVAVSRREYDRESIDRDLEHLQQLIDEIDTLRPVGPDGEHGDRHTNTCGCENVVGTQTPNENPSPPPVPENVIISELFEALRLTVEYVGTETLRPYPGWSWYDVLMKYAPHIALHFKEWEERMAPQRDEARRIQREQNTYPRREGDVVVLGPDTIMNLEHSVISYRGENYHAEKPDPEHVRAWTQWLAEHGAQRIGVAEALVRAGIEVPH